MWGLPSQDPWAPSDVNCVEPVWDLFKWVRIGSSWFGLGFIYLFNDYDLLISRLFNDLLVGKWYLKGLGDYLLFKIFLGRFIGFYIMIVI